MDKKIFIILLLIIIVISGVIYFTRYYKNSSAGNQNSPQNTDVEAKNAITVANFSFSPAELEVAKGETVVWTNQDSAPHQITGASFNSDILSKGSSFSFTFDTAGAYDYHCNIHPSMKGKIIVQ